MTDFQLFCEFWLDLILAWSMKLKSISEYISEIMVNWAKIDPSSAKTVYFPRVTTEFFQLSYKKAQVK